MTFDDLIPRNLAGLSLGQIFDGAVDGGDLALAAWALLAHPSAFLLPQVVTEPFAQVAFRRREPTALLRRQLCAAWDFLEEPTRHVQSSTADRDPR